MKIKSKINSNLNLRRILENLIIIKRSVWIFTCFFFISSCKFDFQKVKNISAIEKKSEVDSVDIVIDSLLMGKMSCDNFNYKHYLINKKAEILESLIDKIDLNYKVNLYEPKQYDERISTRQITKSYVGVKAMCLFNSIICDSLEELQKDDKALCRICVAGMMTSNGGDVNLQNLKQTKKHYDNWLHDTKIMNLNSKRLIWINNYNTYIDSNFIKLW